LFDPASISFQRQYEEDSGAFSLTVRLAQLADLTELVEVISTSFRPGNPLAQWFSPVLRLGLYEDLRYRLRSLQPLPTGQLPTSPAIFCLVAVRSPLQPYRRDSCVAGTVELTLRSPLPAFIGSSYYPYLSNLAVRVECRRQGIARRLLSACEEMAQRYGCQELYLHVLEDNYQARRLYRRSGYRLLQADPIWHRWLLRRPRRLLLHKQLSQGGG